MTFISNHKPKNRLDPTRKTCAEASGSYFGKRTLDLLFVMLVLPIALPLMAGLTCIIAMDGANPIFRQNRVGRNGRTFRMIKLRTMVPNAEKLLADLFDADPALCREWREYQKLANDPRITRIGKFLRQSSLDELPQILNVLRGEMSLVGPRPMMPEQIQDYPESCYFLMRPGLTGPWQISDRNAVSFAARADFDRSYLEQQSFMNDMRILFGTVAVVIQLSGR